MAYSHEFSHDFTIADDSGANSSLELDGHLLEGALRQQVPLDAAQRLVGVVVGLLHQTQLLADWKGMGVMGDGLYVSHGNKIE